MARWITLSSAALVAATGIAAPASAVFPGRNGRLALSAETRFGGSAQNAVLWDYSPSSHKRRQLTKRGASCRLESSTSFADDWVDGGPDYSPDGRWIAYLHADNCPGAESREGLWIMRANGSETRRLAAISLYGVNIVNGLETAFSPDALSVALIHDVAGSSGENALTVFDASDGAIQQQVTLQKLGGQSGLDWGTNGRLVASLADIGSQTPRLYVMSRNGG